MRTEIIGFNNPQVRIFNANAKLLVNTGEIQLGYEMINFEYSFDEGDRGDTGRITFGVNHVSYMDHELFSTQRAIFISWGYPGFMCPPLKVWVLDIDFMYGAKGLTVVIELTNNLALFNKNKNPVLIKALELHEYAKELKNVQVETQTPTLDYIYSGGLYYRVNRETDSEGNTYKLPVVVASPGVSQDPQTWGMESHFQKMSYNSAAFPILKVKEEDPFMQELQSDMNAGGFTKYENYVKVYPGAAVNVEPADRKTSAAPINSVDGALENVFGLNPNDEGSGNSVKSAVEDLMTKSSNGTYKVTSSAGKIILHNRKLLGNPKWVYKLQAEGGDLLEFRYSTNNKYTKKTLASILSIDPNTGNLNLKAYSQAIMDATEPDRESPEADQEFYFRKRGINWFMDRLGSGTGLKKNDFYHENLKNNFNDWQDTDGNWHTARDNTAVVLPHVMIPQSASEVLEEAADRIIKNMQSDEEKIKATFTILGNPLFTCSIKTIFDGLANRHSGTYYITKATHSITKEGGYVVNGECYFMFPTEGVLALKSTITKEQASVNIKKVNKITETVVIAGGLVNKSQGVSMRAPDGINLTVQYIVGKQLKIATINIGAKQYKKIKDEIVAHGKENINFLYRWAGANYQVKDFNFIYGDKRPVADIPSVSEMTSDMLNSGTGLNF